MYRNLEGELRKRGVTRQRIASDMHLNISTISRKLTEPGRLKLWEAFKIRDLYCPEADIEYLFAPDIGTDRASVHTT